MALFLKGTDSSGVDTVIAVETDGSINVNSSGTATDENDVKAVNLDGYKREVQIDGTDTYIAWALPGTALSAASWRACKVDTNGTRTWADADTDFDNVATDLTALTYGS